MAKKIKDTIKVEEFFDVLKIYYPEHQELFVTLHKSSPVYVELNDNFFTKPEDISNACMLLERARKEWEKLIFASRS